MGLFEKIFGKTCGICHENKAREEDEYGRPICTSCILEKEAQQEKKIKCPVDGTEMLKEIWEGELIVDRCPKCKGAFLDEGEIGYLMEEAEDSAHPYPIFVPMPIRT